MISSDIGFHDNICDPVWEEGSYRQNITTADINEKNFLSLCFYVCMQADISKS